MKQTSANVRRPRARRPGPGDSGSWLFLSNHLHVLACISREPQSTIRELGDSIGISERAAAQIVTDLEQAGYLTRSRVGRRNRYQLHLELPLRHPLNGHRTIGQLLDILNRGLPRH
jgi:hypothetical protein